VEDGDHAADDPQALLGFELTKYDLNGDDEEDDDDNLHNFDKIYTNTKKYQKL